MSPKEVEQERREVVGRVQYRYQEAETRRLKAEQEAAIARLDQSNLSAAMKRAQLPFPDGDICPECWIMHGRLSSMRPVPSPEPHLFDRWKCLADNCGHTSDRRTGTP